MSDRLGDVTARIATVHQLQAVVTAMRGIAAARAREARARLDGVRAHAGVVADAIGRALTFLPGPVAAPAGGSGGQAVVAICAEQGFAGAFSERVLDAAWARLDALDASAEGELFLVGDRGLLVAEERGRSVGWNRPMIAHVDHAADLADRIADALTDGMIAGRIATVTVIHTTVEPGAPPRVIEKRILPFDFGRFRPAATAVAPCLTLPPDLLLARLAEQYVFAELCEAIVLSFAAENEVRMRAMIAARAHVADTLTDLTGEARRLRQQEITEEIVELASGTLGAA